MGPLSGLKILEFEAIGPGPFCGMMLADMGADVLLVDRPGDAGLGLGRERWFDVMMRGRRSATLDLKSKSGAEAALADIGQGRGLGVAARFGGAGKEEITLLTHSYWAPAGEGFGPVERGGTEWPRPVMSADQAALRFTALVFPRRSCSSS